MSPSQVMLFYLTKKTAADLTKIFNVARNVRDRVLDHPMTPLATGAAAAGGAAALDASKGRPFDPFNTAALGVIGGLITSPGAIYGARGGRYGAGIKDFEKAQKSGNWGDLSKSTTWKPDASAPGHYVHEYLDPSLKTIQTVSTKDPGKVVATLKPLSSESAGNAWTKNIGIKAGLGLGVEAHHLLSGGSKIVDDSAKKIDDTLKNAAKTMGNIEKVTSDVALTGERASRGIEDLGATSKKMGEFFTSPWAKGAIVATGGLAVTGLAYLLYKTLTSKEPEPAPQVARAPRSRSGSKRMRYAPVDHTHDTPKSEQASQPA